MFENTQCAAGRTLFSREIVAHGLDWATPCPERATEEIPLRDPLWLCRAHAEPLMDALFAHFDRLGLIDHSITG